MPNLLHVPDNIKTLSIEIVKQKAQKNVVHTILRELEKGVLPSVSRP
jgi:hypothetical protein